MINIIEKVLLGLIKRIYYPDKEFKFYELDPFDDKQGYSQEVLFNIKDTNYWIQSNINWTCHIIKGMRGDYFTPDDPDKFILNYIEIEDFIFGDGEDEHRINMTQFPKIEKLFLEYLKSLWNLNEKLNYKGIMKYKDFLFEYEGGPPTKDPIKIGSSMITDIYLEQEEDDDNNLEIDILRDFKDDDA